LRLSTGASVYGGFTREDPVSSIRSYACSFYAADKSSSLVLRQFHNAAVLGEDMQDKTIEEAGLYPRSTLAVSIQSDEGRVAVVEQVSVAGDCMYVHAYICLYVLNRVAVVE
jgi:hypothetical protein